MMFLILLVLIKQTHLVQHLFKNKDLSSYVKPFYGLCLCYEAPHHFQKPVNYVQHTAFLCGGRREQSLTPDSVGDEHKHRLVSVI